MKKFLSIVLALTLGITALSAQEYKNAIGLRIGYDVSVTYKTFVSQSNFVDVGINLTPWGGDFGATLYGFYDWNFSIGQVPGLSWYVGPGAQVGLYAKSFYLTINGQIGLEYKFQNAPITLSLDYAPGLGIVFGKEAIGFGYAGFFGGLGVRYTF